MQLLTLSLLPAAVASLTQARDPTFGGSFGGSGSASGSADISVIVDAVSSCTTQIRSCDKAVVGLDVDVSGSVEIDFSAVATAFTGIITTFDSACSAIKTAGSLAVTDLLALSTSIQPLQIGCGQLVADLIAKKTMIAHLGSCGTVAGFGAQVQGSAKALLEAVLDIVPGPLDDIVKLAADMSGGFELGIMAFGSGNCSNSGAGSGSGSGSGSGHGSGHGSGGGSGTVVISASASMGYSGGATVTATAGGSGSGSGSVGFSEPCACTEATTLETATLTGTTVAATVTLPTSASGVVVGSNTTATRSPTATVVTAGAAGLSRFSIFGVLAVIAVSLLL